MTISKLLLFITALLPHSLLAQNSKETYRFSETIAAELLADSTGWKYQMGAAAYSNSGYYKEALTTWDKNGAGKTTLSSEDSIYLKTFHSGKAKDYIIERSKKEQIIIINEAHHNSSHRAFTHSLLKELYNNGYRYFGLEAIADTLINIRKFPVMESGYYTKEPEFGNLLSAALQIGFILFPYEASAEKNGLERETEQAENIANFIAKNSSGKVLIHCGFDHVIEGPHKRWGKAMAGRLKEFSGIDPFTIDQVQCSEKGDKKYNSSYIEMINPMYPAILINDSGETFNGRKGSDQTDCSIIHPVTEYLNDRPNWLLSNKDRQWYKLPDSKITSLPALILAYRNNEFDKNGVPSDIIEITGSDKSGYLILSPGKYDIIIKDKNYKITNRYQEEIK